jgi:hypothetical protein
MLPEDGAPPTRLPTSMQFPELPGLTSVSAVVVEAEEIIVADRASSLTISPDHLEGDDPLRSAVEKQSKPCTLSPAGKRRQHR